MELSLQIKKLRLEVHQLGPQIVNLRLQLGVRLPLPLVEPQHLEVDGEREVACEETPEDAASAGRTSGPAVSSLLLGGKLGLVEISPALTQPHLLSLAERHLAPGSHHLLAMTDDVKSQVILALLLHPTNVQLDTELLAADEEPVGSGHLTNLGGLQLLSKVPDIDHVGRQSFLNFSFLVVERYDLLTAHLAWSRDNLPHSTV